MPRREGMERKDLLAANVKIFKVQGEALDKFAKKSVKVIRTMLTCNVHLYTAGAGGGEPGQHQRSHLLPLRPLHSEGKLLCHDKVDSGHCIVLSLPY